MGGGGAGGCPGCRHGVEKRTVVIAGADEPRPREPLGQLLRQPVLRKNVVNDPLLRVHLLRVFQAHLGRADLVDGGDDGHISRIPEGCGPENGDLVHGVADIVQVLLEVF